MMFWYSRQILSDLVSFLFVTLSTSTDCTLMHIYEISFMCLFVCMCVREREIKRSKHTENNCQCFQYSNEKSSFYQNNNTDCSLSACETHDLILTFELLLLSVSTIKPSQRPPVRASLSYSYHTIPSNPTTIYTVDTLLLFVYVWGRGEGSRVKRHYDDIWFFFPF